MSFPRHLRKKRPKRRPNPKPGRLDLRSVKLRSSALGRCQRTQLEWAINRFALKELTSMDSALFMPNEPNSGGRGRDIRGGDGWGRWRREQRADGRAELGSGRAARFASCH